MMIHKITPFVDYNYWFVRQNTHPNDLTNQNATKVPNYFKSINKKTSL